MGWDFLKDVAIGGVANLVGSVTGMPGVGTAYTLNKALDGGLGQAAAFSGLGFNGLFGSNRCQDFLGYGAAQFTALDRYLGAGGGCGSLPLPALNYGAYPWGCGDPAASSQDGMRTLLGSQDAFLRGDMNTAKGLLNITKAMFEDMDPTQRLSFVTQAQAVAPEAFLALLRYGDSSGVRRLR